MSKCFDNTIHLFPFIYISLFKVFDLYFKEIPYEIAGRRKGDVDSLYASCDKAEQVVIYLYIYLSIYFYLSIYIYIYLSIYIYIYLSIFLSSYLSRSWTGNVSWIWRLCAGICGIGKQKIQKDSIRMLRSTYLESKIVVALYLFASFFVSIDGFFSGLYSLLLLRQQIMFLFFALNDDRETHCYLRL